MVWNRRASKQGGKVNPPSEWVWSAAPTHPAIISRELFDAAVGIAASHAGSRDGAGPNTAHPQAKRAYLLRSLLTCKLCGRRMFGKTRRGHAYYACQLPAIPPRTPSHDPQHPKSLWVSEAALLDGVSAFFATRVFGADRRALLDGALDGVLTMADQHHQRRLKALTRALADNQRRQARLVTSLEDDDTPAGTRQIRTRLAELEAEHQAKTAELAALSHQRPTRQPQATELLDALPVSDVRLAAAEPEVLRGLFEAFHLEIVFDKPAKVARCRVTLSEDSLPILVSRLES